MKLWVNVYVSHLAYGGPEEGGWWYEAGQFIHRLPAKNAAQAERVARRLTRRFASLDDGRPMSSVLSTGALRVYVQPFPGADYPGARPRYE